MSLFQFRENTFDHAIFLSIVQNNEYRLPSSFAPQDIIIDIGAHIGCFTYAAISRGAGKVVAVEAERQNYQIAFNHLTDYIESGSVILRYGAAWRSDEEIDELFHSGYLTWKDQVRHINTGGATVIMKGGKKPTRAIPFDPLLLEATDNGQQRIRLLKLDCEGSEYPILFTSRNLHLVDQIIGEFHEIGGRYLEFDDNFPEKEINFCLDRNRKFTINELQSYLESNGFQTSYFRHKRPSGIVEGQGLFFATRDT